ncbi:MAG: hypothetical protein K2K08_05365, partial [Paramuribaculum sp.]|nr:hypothetical protein [Paramuribaculum sp.]
GPGIEPGWVAPPVFETGASTDSAIRAIRFGAAKVVIVYLWCNQLSIFNVFLAKLHQREYFSIYLRKT